MYSSSSPGPADAELHMRRCDTYFGRPELLGLTVDLDTSNLPVEPNTKLTNIKRRPHEQVHLDTVLFVRVDEKMANFSLTSVLVEKLACGFSTRRHSIFFRPHGQIKLVKENLAEVKTWARVDASSTLYICHLNAFRARKSRLLNMQMALNHLV